MTSYATPPGGLPPQSDLLTGRARFAEAWAVIPRGTMRDIVTSNLPGWGPGARAWILARPLSGFAETFSWAIVEMAPGAEAPAPEPDPGAEGVIFVAAGEVSVSVAGETHALGAGGYAYLPAGVTWSLVSGGGASVHWVRKLYEPLDGVTAPAPFVSADGAVAPVPMPGTDGRWATTRFVDPADMAHDMHVNIVTLAPGAVIPFAETHVMEHGLYVLQGKGVYRLNDDWVEVEAGDFMWLRAFCPQACYAGGPEPFRYLLYKDVNRTPKLRP